ncbi:hypothetical protein DINM_001316 [Dirofilaria immitis]|nr:hypothetical protein [Dirofilaria immitis]
MALLLTAAIRNETSYGEYTMRLERFEYHVICLSSSDIEGNDGMLCNIQRHDLFSVRVGCSLLIRDIITKFPVTFSYAQLKFNPTVVRISYSTTAHVRSDSHGEVQKYSPAVRRTVRRNRNRNSKHKNSSGYEKKTDPKKRYDLSRKECRRVKIRQNSAGVKISQETVIANISHSMLYRSCNFIFVPKLSLFRICNGHQIAQKTPESGRVFQKFLYASTLTFPIMMLLIYILIFYNMRRKRQSTSNQDKTYGTIALIPIRNNLATQAEINDQLDLNEHNRTDANKKLFECNVFSKRFSRTRDLKRHYRTHTGKKPFQCDECDKRFNDASSLKKHRRIHTSEKPFKCDECKKEFSSTCFTRILAHFL